MSTKVPARRQRSTRQRTGKDCARDHELALRYQRSDDLSARQTLIERFLPLARKLAFRYRQTHEPVDDLVQVASVGLVKAVDRYDPERGKGFSSYAAPTILGELRRYFRDHAWALHVPRDLQEAVLAVNSASARLSTELGRSPTVREVAKATGRSGEQVLEAMEAGQAYDTASLDAPVSEETDSPALADEIGSRDERFETVEERDAIARAWSCLPEVEGEVMRLRFEQGLTQSEIGEQVGCSQMQVSRLLRRALERLREETRAAV